MKAGSLFSGTGALDMAASAVLGCEPVWFVEQNAAASKVLAHHWPHAPNLGDITAVDWATVDPVDVLTGGFPCQDISNAGKRAGIEGERSGLWSYFADAIRVLRPRYVLVENVSALVVRGLDRVLADLAALGFDAEWAAVRASDVGAAHRRERIFLAAADTRCDARPEDHAHGSTAAGGCRAVVADSDDVGHERHREARRGRAGLADSGGTAADSDGRQRDRREPGTVGGPVGRAAVAGGRQVASSDTAGDGRGEGRPKPAGQLGGPDAAKRRGDVVEWREYGPAIQQHERLIGRPAPAPTIVGARGGPKLSPYFTEWLMGLPEGHITSVPGINVNDMLRLCGNGVVTAQAVAAYRYLLPLLGSQEVAA